MVWQLIRNRRFSIWVLSLLCFLDPSRVNAQKWEKVIDDGEPGYSETGNAWKQYTNPAGYKGDYRYLSHFDQGRKRVGTATWQVVVPYTGRYEVFVHFRATVNRTPDADYNVYDGSGKRHHFSLNQKTLASGWHKLGTFSYAKGQTSRVVLDGTDDNYSDEADAVRWKFVTAAPPPPPPPPPTKGCEETTPGTYTKIQYAGNVKGYGDWKNPSLATGSPNQQEAFSPNVDKGDELVASKFQWCTPKGNYKISRVRVGILARMQYASSQYKLIMFWSSSGRRFTFSQTQRLWAWGDITSAKSTWTIKDLEGLTIKTGLHSHPGGKRDSDAWVDAFAVEVQYTIGATICPKGQKLCSGRCVVLGTSTSHCGACENKCPSNATCLAGKCTQSCVGGLTLCQQKCVNLQTEISHCGRCGNACLESEVCLRGKCSLQCPSGESLCGTQCTNLSRDQLNCGACQKVCKSDEFCSESQCQKLPVCAKGQKFCSGQCVDVQSDPTRCGDCAVVCGQGVACEAGRCVPAGRESNDQEPPPAEEPTVNKDASSPPAPVTPDSASLDSSGADLRHVTRTRGCLCNSQSLGLSHGLLLLLVLLVMGYRRSSSP